MLSKIEAILLGKNDDALSYKIASKELIKYSFAELEKMRSYYKAEIKEIKI